MAPRKAAAKKAPAKKASPKQSQPEPDPKPVLSPEDPGPGFHGEVPDPEPDERYTLSGVIAAMRDDK